MPTFSHRHIMRLLLVPYRKSIASQRVVHSYGCDSLRLEGICYPLPTRTSHFSEVSIIAIAISTSNSASAVSLNKYYYLEYYHSYYFF